jgi:hypothetical protein
VFLEGLTESTVSDNTFDGGATLAVQSNSGYDDPHVLNPRKMIISGNTFKNTARYVTVFIRYDTKPGATSNSPGGGNSIVDNIIVNANGSGILIFGTVNAMKDTPDTISRNRITNTNVSHAGTTNVGSGIFDNAGIALGIGDGDVVTDNTISDNQRPPSTPYGITIGAALAMTTATHTRLAGNTASGLKGPLTHYA